MIFRNNNNQVTNKKIILPHKVALLWNLNYNVVKTMFLLDLYTCKEWKKFASEFAYVNDYKVLSWVNIYDSSIVDQYDCSCVANNFFATTFSPTPYFIIGWKEVRMKYWFKGLLWQQTNKNLKKYFRAYLTVKVFTLN